jgi:hypothetical protein
MEARMTEDSKKQNEIAKTEGGRAVTPSGHTAYGEYARAAGANRIPLLKFTKIGTFVYGPNDEKLPLGKRLIAHMRELEVGYQHWVEGYPQEWKGGRLSEGYTPPPRHSLGDNDESLWETYSDGRPKQPWPFTNRLPMTDPERGETYLFTTQTKGGLGAIGQLCEAYDTLLLSDPDSDKEPIVALGSDSYPHRNREWGDIPYPVFELVGWTGDDEPEPAKLAAAAAPAVATVAMKRKAGSSK